MTTSGAYTVSKTANQIVDGILRWIGVIGATQSASPEDSEAVIEAINFWLFQKKGPEHIGRPGQMLWLRETAELELTQNQYLYELKPSGGDLDIQIPIGILAANLRNTNDDDTPLEPITRAEYELITDKTAAGMPDQYCYEKKLDVGNLYIHMAPDETAADYTVQLLYRQPIEVITAGTQTLDIEDFWYRALKFNVALDVAPEFDAQITDIHKQLAQNAMAEVNTFYPEDAGDIFFEPERDDY
jgi:hypothetical protein